MITAGLPLRHTVTVQVISNWGPAACDTEARERPLTERSSRSPGLIIPDQESSFKLVPHTEVAKWVRGSEWSFKYAGEIADNYEVFMEKS